MAVISFLLLTAFSNAQVPFTTDGQLYAIESVTGDFIHIEISNSNGSILVTEIAPNLGAGLSALGYRYQDRLIYAIDNETLHLIQIDANGMRYDLGLLNLPSDLYYASGAIDQQGKFMTVIGSNNDFDQSVFKISLTNQMIEEFDIGGYDLRIADLAFDPATNIPYGFDANRNSVFNSNEELTNFSFKDPINFDNGIQGLFFNSFNELKAFGSTAFGIASALFTVDKSNGSENLNTTGPQLFINDLVSLPYTIELRQKIRDRVIFPCSELEFNYPISNQTGKTHSGVSFELDLPDAFSYVETLHNPFSSIVEYDAVTNSIKVENFTLSSSLDSLSFIIEVADVAANKFDIQGRIFGIDIEWGMEKWSDDPASSRYRASTKIEIIRPTEDSLSVERFICLGQSFLADYSEFGNNLVWQDGTNDPVFEINSPGTYFARSENECIDFEVNYDITFASCPFTISMYYSFEPDTIFPCNELLIKYDIRNDSGLTRGGVSINDTLPANFKILGTQGNLLGGKLVDGIAENIINITDIDLPIGEHQIIVIAELMEADAGLMYSRSYLSGFPISLGPFRLSDDPRSPEFDSSYLSIRGIAQDSIVQVRFICNGIEVALDVSDYGYDPVWEDGSTSELRVVDQVGLYEVQINNGCEFRTLFFDVQSASQIEIIMENEFDIHQGEQIDLNPKIENEANTFEFEWTTIMGDPLSCEECLTQEIQALSDANYQLKVWNEHCTDSMSLVIHVDESRRIYAANIFSPNNDGINDYFYLTSPDFGIIRQLQIHDRWGGVLYSSYESNLNDVQSSWDGSYKNATNAPSGVYQWSAEIEFVDKKKSWFFGDITIIR